MTNAANIGKFWSDVKDHPFLAARPQLRARPDLAQVVPIALHCQLHAGPEGRW